MSDSILYSDDIDARLVGGVKMEKRTIHLFGESVIDVEGTLGPKLAGGVSLTTENLTLPNDMGLRVNEPGNVLYGKILFDERTMETINGHIRIPVDKKYYLDGILLSMSDAQLDRWKQDENINDFLDISFGKKSGGGGAHNAAYCAQVYLNDVQSLPLEVRLVVPNKSSFIAENLPKGLGYDSIFESIDNLVPSNLNVSLEYGKKLTFRSRKSGYTKYVIDRKKIKDNDIIAIDSIKDKAYIEAIKGVRKSRPNLDLYLAVTDSMIKNLKREYTYRLALESDLCVCNNDEFNMLTDKKVSNDVEMVIALESFQDDHFRNSGKSGTIAVTYGENGSIICDRNRNIYFQPTALASKTSPYTLPTPIVNTNGCGDAYFAVMAVGHAAGYSSIIKLNYANAAGHLCAFKPTATDLAMPTESGIESYRRNFSSAPIYSFNHKSKKFEPIGL